MNLTALNALYQGGASPPGTPLDGTVWNVICKLGYNWADLALVKTINCSDRVWNLPVACTRK